MNRKLFFLPTLKMNNPGPGVSEYPFNRVPGLKTWKPILVPKSLVS